MLVPIYILTDEDEQSERVGFHAKQANNNDNITV